MIALWQDNGGYISPSNSNDVMIDNNLHVLNDAHFSGFMTAIHGAILDVMSDAHFMNDVEMHGFMTRIMGGIFEVASSSEFYGSSNFHGDANFQGPVRRWSPEMNPEDLTSKGYVDGADAAIMDSLTALDSTMTANALWQDNGGYISPSNSNDVMIDNNLHVLNDAHFSGFMTAIHGAILDVMSDAHFMNDVEMNGFMTRIMGGIFEVASSSEFYGSSNFHGPVRRYSPEMNPEDLTSKGYVDGADAAIMDSLTALDSTMTANALWQDNGGYISPSNSNDVMIDNNLHVLNDAHFSGFMTAIHGAILDVMSDAHFMNDVEMNGFMTRIMGGIFEVASSSEFYGSSNFHGDVRRYSPEMNPEDLTSKGYVDGADAAIMDSLTALDSTMTANALWQDNGGYISPSNSNDVMIDNNLHVLNDAHFSGFMTAIHGAILDVMSDAHFMNDVEMNGFMTRIMGGIFEVASSSEFYGSSNFHGDVRRYSPEMNPEDLTSKGYVDGADAAIMDSITALDSTMAANSFWSVDGSGNLSNTNTGSTVNVVSPSVHLGNPWSGINIDGMMDRVQIGDIYGGVTWDMWGGTIIGDGFYGIQTDGPGGIVNINSFDITLGMGNTSDIVDVEATLNVDYDANIVGNLYANGGVLLSSDRRFKKDINTVENALEKVLRLRGVNYYWKQNEFPNKNFDDKLELGLIAQEVELIIPEIVGESSDGYKAVEYQKLVALLIEAIKEQQSIIDSQKDEMADMRVELDERLKVLEGMINTTTLNK